MDTALPLLPMQNLLTPNARILLDRAHQEARRFRHDVVRPEHVLLALLKMEPEGVQAIFHVHQRDPYEIWQEVKRTQTPGHTPEQQPLTLAPEIVGLIEIAGQEAEQLRHGQIAPDHLFLALLRTAAIGPLQSAGFDLERAREEVRRRPGPIDQETMLMARRPEAPILPRQDLPAPLAPLPILTVTANPPVPPTDAEFMALDWQIQVTQIVYACTVGAIGGYLLYGNVDGAFGVGAAAFVVSLFRHSTVSAFAGGLLGFILGSKLNNTPLFLIWVGLGIFVGSFVGDFWVRFAPQPPAEETNDNEEEAMP